MLDSHWENGETLLRFCFVLQELEYQKLSIKAENENRDCVLINSSTISLPMSQTKHISPFQPPVFSLTLSHVPVTRMHLCPALPLGPSVGG